MQYQVDEIQAKWKAVLEHPDLPKIGDVHKRRTVAQLLENTQRECGQYRDQSQFLLKEDIPPTNAMGLSSSTPGTGAIDTFDPVLISLIRRAMPNLIAYELCGVQPMTGPTGLIFAMRSRYANSGYGANTGNEAFFYEADTGWSAREGANAASNTQGGAANTGPWANNTVPGGASNNLGNTTYTIPAETTYSSNLAMTNTYNYAGSLLTALAEGLGGNSTSVFPEMAFSIERITVTAGSRALKAEYSMELAQDLKAIHGLDAETELSNILSTEILAEINREVIRTLNVCAVPGAQDNTTTASVFDLDVDSNGRWMVEKFKGLHFQIEREANQIAKQTRRGKGNLVLCSSDVASALQMTGMLSNTPALNGNHLEVDDMGNTFAGVLNNRMKVFIDPYALGGQYMTVGYKGNNPFDAGFFYCPYVPLQMVRAVDPSSFQPKIAFKTRYGMVANPFAVGMPSGHVSGTLTQDSNQYYRRVLILNLQ